MDIGTIKNLLVWVEKEHPKPVRINDTLLDTDQTRELVSYLKKAIALADGLKGRMEIEDGSGITIIKNYAPIQGNPWQDLDLLKTKLMIHPKDLPYILAYNQTVGKKKDFNIALHVPPLPYAGNPKAPVVVLLANPGLSDSQRRKSFAAPESELSFRMKNLLHEPGFTSNHLIWSEQKGSPPLSKWFTSRTRKLIEATSAKQVADGIFFANFHPYHSKSWHNIAFTLPTQHYTFNLIKDSIARGAIILMSRNLTGWQTSVPELLDYKNKTYFKSSRSVHLSPKNLDSKFYKLILNQIN